jgi:hypothetical protein
MAGERESHEAGVPLPAATSIRRPPANAGVAPLNAHTRTTTAVQTYIRQSWGNKASAITPEQVKAVRAEIGNRTQPWTAEQLNAIQ